MVRPEARLATSNTIDPVPQAGRASVAQQEAHAAGCEGHEMPRKSSYESETVYRCSKKLVYRAAFQPRYAASPIMPHRTVLGPPPCFPLIADPSQSP